MNSALGKLFNYLTETFASIYAKVSIDPIIFEYPKFAENNWLETFNVSLTFW